MAILGSTDLAMTIKLMVNIMTSTMTSTMTTELWMAVMGGLLIGLASVLLLSLAGRVAGVSGICGAPYPRSSRISGAGFFLPA
jgi:formate/nitrite transporter FocA (FNT family)